MMSVKHSSPWGITQKGSPTLESVARLLKDDEIKNVVILAGAGISTASGIPDFRSPKTGLYANLKKYNLPYPEAIFDINYFQEKPQPFFTLSKELYPGNFKPTLTHSFFKLLDDKKKLLRVFTQNIDTVERIAGLSSDRIVEAHGSFATSRCISCHKKVEEDWIKEKVMSAEIAYCPNEKCKGKKTSLVKPDIVFFGEGLPERFFQQIKDLRSADLLIIMGTSLQVHPFASLIDQVKSNCPRVLINLERVGELASTTSFGMKGLMNENGFDFEGWTLSKGKGKENIRDVFIQSKCDEAVKNLVKEIGWEKELFELHDSINLEKTKSIKNDNKQLKEAKEKAIDTAKKVSNSDSTLHNDELIEKISTLNIKTDDNSNPSKKSTDESL